jgi:hypothetical protein
LLAASACEQTADRCAWHKISQEIPIESGAFSTKEGRIAACRAAVAMNPAEKRRTYSKAFEGLLSDTPRESLTTMVALADAGYARAIAPTFGI